MSYAAFEAVLLALAFVASAAYAAAVLMPDAMRDLRKRALIAALRPSRPSWVRQLARRYAPTPRIATPAAASGCGPCTGCKPSGH